MTDAKGYGLKVYAVLLSARVPVTYTVVSQALDIEADVALLDLYDLEARGLATSTCLPGGGVLWGPVVLPSTQEGST